MRHTFTARTKFRRAATFLGGAVAVALLCLGLASCTSTVGYAAIVNGAVISQGTLNQDLADIAANTQFVKLAAPSEGSVLGSSPGGYNKAYVATLLQQLIQAEIIHQILVAAKALPTPAQVSTGMNEVSQSVASEFQSSTVFGQFKASYQKIQATQQADIDSFVTVETRALPSKLVDQYYQSHLGEFASENCVRYILIADKTKNGELDERASLADAQRIKALLNGGADFAALAKEYSQDNQGSNGGSAAQGGVVPGTATDGCLAMSDLQQIVTSFVDAVVSLPVNQVSNPVLLPNGYGLIEVTSRVLEPVTSVTQQIDEDLAGQKYVQLIAKAKVKVNPEFGSFEETANLSGAAPTVVPPPVPTFGTTTTTEPASSGSSGG